MEGDDGGKVRVPFKTIPRPTNGVTIACPTTPLVTGNGVEQQRSLQSSWVEVRTAVIAGGDSLDAIWIQTGGVERRKDNIIIFDKPELLRLIRYEPVSKIEGWQATHRHVRKREGGRDSEEGNPVQPSQLTPERPSEYRIAQPKGIPSGEAGSTEDGDLEAGSTRYARSNPCS